MRTWNYHTTYCRMMGRYKTSRKTFFEAQCFLSSSHKASTRSGGRLKNLKIWPYRYMPPFYKTKINPEKIWKWKLFLPLSLILLWENRHGDSLLSAPVPSSLGSHKLHLTSLDWSLHCLVTSLHFTSLQLASLRFSSVHSPLPFFQQKHVRDQEDCSQDNNHNNHNNDQGRASACSKGGRGQKEEQAGDRSSWWEL